MIKWVSFKDDVNIEEICYMNPLLWQIFSYVVGFCAENSIRMVITSIYRPPNDGISVSSTHQEYRAFDVSFKSEHGWNDNKIQKLVEEIEEHFKPIGALSKSSGESRPIVVHNSGSGLHGHFQIRKI